MDRLYCTLLSCCVAMLFSVAGSTAAPIQFSVDFAQFRQDSVNTLVEMYYSFPDTAISYKSLGKNSYLGELEVTVEFRSNLGVTSVLQWVMENRKVSLVSDARNNIYGQKNISIKPDQYVVMLKLRDLNDPRRIDSTKMNMLVRKFSQERIQFSDIELANAIEYPHNTSRTWLPEFKKGDMFVLPQPNIEICDTTPQLNAYIEIYNLKKIHADSITIAYNIMDAAKRSVFDLQYVRPIVANDQIEVFRSPLDALNSGAYYLKATVQYADNDVKDSSSIIKKFFLINPGMPAEIADLYTMDELFLQSEFSTMSEARVDKEFETVKYIASQTEKDTYLQLTTLGAKQKYMFRFWLERDPNPSTKENERLSQHRKAMDYANKNYDSPIHLEGWRSDRGRILLKYGFPTQIDRQYFQLGVRPHEIWYYNDIQGGVIFCFVARDGVANNYKLVHSTALNEIREDNWYKRYAELNNVNPDELSGRKGSSR